MFGKKSFMAQELARFGEAVWLELPAVAGKALLGMGGEKELREAGWKAYDAWVSLANEVMNTVYADHTVGETTSRMMESALRLRQFGGTMTTAFFGNLWPSIGLPTHSEMVTLRGELLALRDDLAAYTATMPLPAEPAEPASKDPDDSLRPIWKGARLNGHRAMNGNGNVPRPSHQGKRHVAA